MAQPLLSIPGFAVFLLGRFAIGVVIRGLAVAVGYQIYEITGDPMALGYVGLALFLPIICFGLVAGDIADRMNKAVMLSIATLFCGACCAGFFILSIQEVEALAPFYGLTAIFGTALAFSRPPQPSLVPQLVGPEQTPNAVAVSSAVGQSATILGPMLAGILLIFGPATAYAALALTALAAAICWLLVVPHARPGAAGAGQSIIQRISEGFGIVVRTRLILGAMSLDFFAVLLGSVVALLPVFARDILMVGPFGLGLLRAAPAIGATLVAVVMARMTSPGNAGRIIFSGTTIFGLAIIVFGLSENLYLSLAALFLAGAADMASNILRNSTVQLAAPRTALGRVNSVNQIFVSGSNELGDFRAGMSAGLIGTVPAVLVGGIGTIVVAGLWAWLFPNLRKLDRLADIRPDDPPRRPGA